MNQIVNNRGVMKYSIYLLLVFILFLTGCLLRYEDVSDEPEYAPLIGSFHELKTNMLIQGVNMDRGYGDRIHHYTVKPFDRRSGGPQIRANITFHAGRKVKVSSVQKSTMPVLFSGKKIRVILRSDIKLKPKAPLVVDLKYLLSTNYFEKTENGAE